MNVLFAPDSSGWVYYSGGSPKGSKYILLNRATTFSGGQEECLKKGGYLAHVTSIREQVFVEDFLSLELQDKGQSCTRHLGVAFSTVG